MAAFPFEELDFIYAPSRDVATDLSYFADVLGGKVVFTIAAKGTRVAMIDLTGESPRLLLTDHLEGESPILIYRVPSLKDALDELEGRGWERVGTFEIPYGPCCSFRAPGGQRLALYELTRLEVGEQFEGRRDF
jgi:hypothetical protein